MTITREGYPEGWEPPLKRPPPKTGKQTPSVSTVSKPVIPDFRKEQAKKRFRKAVEMIETDPTISEKDAVKASGLDPLAYKDEVLHGHMVVGGKIIPRTIEKYRTMSDIGLERRRLGLAMAWDRFEELMPEATAAQFGPLVSALGTLIDKSRLETGEATQRIEQLNRFENRYTLEVEARERMSQMFPDVAKQLPPPVNPIEQEQRETLASIKEYNDSLRLVGYRG